MSSRRLLTAACTALVALASGCDVNYERSVLTPPVQPLPGDGRAARPGEVRLSGSIVRSSPDASRGGYGDPALWIPSHYYTGEVELGLPSRLPNRHWSLAAIGGTGTSDDATPTAVNAAPVLPDRSTRTWEAGGVLAGDFETPDGRWAIGLSGLLEDAHVTASVWCSGCLGSSSPGTWQFVAAGTQDVPLWSFGLVPSLLLTDPSSPTRLVLFTALSVGDAVTNIGFDSQSGVNPDLTVGTAGAAAASVGLELDMAPVLLRATAYEAVHADAGPQSGVIVTAGASFGGR